VVDGVPILLPPEMVEQGLGCQLGADDNVSMHPYSEASSKIIEASGQGWVLDLGSGGKHIGHANVVQMDVFRFPMTDVVGSADCMPFKANVFRAVVSQAVFEHLQFPEAAASEVWRVLAPDGVAKIDTAFLQPEHAYPHHYFNATEAGLRHWFRDFELEWSGVEPYQHPKWSLVWFLSVYFASLPDEQRKTLEPLGLGECVSVLSRVARGVSTPEDAVFVEAMDGLVPDGVRKLAAGVSVRAVKRVHLGSVPRQQLHAGASNNLQLALERRLESLNRQREIENDAVVADQEWRVIVGDRTRYLLHALDLESSKRIHQVNMLTREIEATHERLHDAMRRAENLCTSLQAVLASRSWQVTKPLRWLTEQVLSGGRAIPATAAPNTVAQVGEALAPKTLHRIASSETKGVETPGQAAKSLSLHKHDLLSVVFVVKPKHPVELLDQFFSLAHQSLGSWALLVEYPETPDELLQEVIDDLAARDSRVILSITTDMSQVGLWSKGVVRLTHDAILASGAVAELDAIQRIYPEVCVITADLEMSTGARGETMRCWVGESVEEPSNGRDEQKFAWYTLRKRVSSPLNDGIIEVGGAEVRRKVAYVPKVLYRMQPYQA